MSAKWKLTRIKTLFLLLLFCGMVFSSIVQVMALAQAQPNTDLANSLEWLRNNSKPGEVVFAHYSEGFFVETIAQRPVVIDELFGQTPDVKNIYNESDAILNSRDLEQTKELLKKHNVQYILLTKDLVGKVWNQEGEGLNFLLTNKETFKKVYSNNFVSIWSIKK